MCVKFVPMSVLVCFCTYTYAKVPRNVLTYLSMIIDDIDKSHLSHS